MEYAVRNEKELAEALKKCEPKDGIWIRSALYNLHRNYIKSFAKNRKLKYQECFWSGKDTYSLTFYQ